MTRWIYFGALLAFQLSAAPPVSEKHAAEMARGLALFKSDVSAVLKQHCVKCHGGDKTRGGLDITTRASLLKGGDEGVVVVPGKSKESLLIRLVSHFEKPHMPAKKPKLPDAAIQKIAQWIDLGAPYDQPLIVKTGPKKGMQVTDDDRNFWSFAPLTKPQVPAVKNKKWTHNEIDQFILRKLEAAKLTPNSSANSRVLIRRVYFDLIGLPPTPKEVDDFLKASIVNQHSALENLVDQLLASKHYGERWGRHWLDVARFAESHGFEQDYNRPHAYHYRDFVIKALNADMPYDPSVLRAAGARGGCDGLKLDQRGNLFATGPGGVLIISPTGKHLGTLATGTRIANVAWGNDGRTLYLTADSYLCRIRTKTKGVGF